MKCLIYSDIHGKELIIPKEKPDIVFCLGDIHWRDLKKIDNHFTCPKIGVLGNHDRMDYFTNTSIVNVHERTIEVLGKKIAGFGGSPRYNHKLDVPQYEGYDARKFVNGLTNVDIFLAHSNPRSEHYRDERDSHRGFDAFNSLMEAKKVTYLFHGHTHEEKEYVFAETHVIVTYGYRYYEL